MPDDRAKQILDFTFKYLEQVLDEKKRDRGEQEIKKRSSQKNYVQKKNDVDSADAFKCSLF